MAVVQNIHNAKHFIRNIDNRLYTGKPVPSLCAMYNMKKMGVTQVIDLREDAYMYRLFEKFACYLFGIKYKNIKIDTDTSSIPTMKFFKNINKTITHNEGKTYLHCKYGRHRTGMCIAAYEKEVLNKDNINVYINLTNRFSELIEQTGNQKLQKKLETVYQKFIKKYHLNEAPKQNPTK